MNWISASHLFRFVLKVIADALCALCSPSVFAMDDGDSCWRLFRSMLVCKNYCLFLVALLSVVSGVYHRDAMRGGQMNGSEVMVQHGSYVLLRYGVT